MDAEVSPGTGNAGTDRTVTVIGVDPADPRAIVELPRWIPADATGLYRVPTLDRRTVSGPTLRQNPPGVAIAALRRLRGDRPSVPTLEDATAAAAMECDLPLRTIDVNGADRQPADRRLANRQLADHQPDTRELQCAAARRSPWWTVSAWTVAALTVGVPIAALALLLLAGGLLVWLLSAMLVVGAVALLVGFVLLSEAAAIRRTDASFAGAIASAGVDFDAEHPVLVVPARNAPGVAAILRQRGVAADAQRVRPGADPVA